MNYENYKPFYYYVSSAESEAKKAGLVVAAIVAVASGVIFWAWDFIYAVPTALFDSRLSISTR